MFINKSLRFLVASRPAASIYYYNNNNIVSSSFSNCLLVSSRRNQTIAAPKDENNSKNNNNNNNNEVAPHLSALADSICSLSLADASQLVKVLKVRLNIQDAPTIVSAGVGSAVAAGTASQAANAGAAGGAAGAAGAAGDDKKEQKKTVSVKLESFPAEAKLKIVKELRTLVPTMQLTDAKKLVESSPSVLKDGLSAEEGKKFKDVLEGVGAKISIV